MPPFWVSITMSYILGYHAHVTKEPKKETKCLLFRVSITMSYILVLY